MRTITLRVLIIGLFLCALAPLSWSQVVVDTLDPRVVFDPKNRDATRIPAILSRIDENERQIDAQLAELERNKNDVANLQSQFRNFSVSPKKDVSFPSEIITNLQKLSTENEKIDYLRQNVNLLQNVSSAMQAYNQDYAKLRILLLSPRRSAQQGTTFGAELAARIGQRLDDSSQQCNLDDVITVLKKDKNDKDRFDDVAINNDNDTINMMSTCASAKQVDLGTVKNTIVAELQTFITELGVRGERLRSTLITLQDTKQKWQSQLRRATEISNSLIDWTIPLLAVSVVALLAIPGLYRLEVQQLVLSNGIILEVFTVFLLITTVLLLGIADRIQSEALGTLLGGISGYVLGRSALRTKGDTESNNNQQRPQEIKPNPVHQETGPARQDENKPAQQARPE